ncbi:hypothetical protein Tco_1356224 [Tanacetum coccineum]
MALSLLSFHKRYRPFCETPTPSSPPVVSPALPPQKRYRGISKLIANTNTKSEDSEDEGTDSESEEAASEDQQLKILVKGTTTDEPLGLGYGAARRRALELAEDTTHNTFEVGQSSRSVPEQQVADHTPRLPVRPTWVDPEDASLIVPSLVTSLVTTPAATIAVDEDEFLDIGAQLQLHRSILHDQTYALWQPVLALEAWARQSDAQRADMWQATTGKLDFEDVYFVKELKFNLFSVSQMCDKKNSVLFTDTECVVLSSDFKLTNENHVLLKVPRKDNMYSVELRNVVPQGGLTCLFAMATLDESNLWHRRMRHINFKTMNDKYGYIRNHKKTIKNKQTRTRERKSVQKPEAKA